MRFFVITTAVKTGDDPLFIHTHLVTTCEREAGEKFYDLEEKIIENGARVSYRDSAKREYYYEDRPGDSVTLVKTQLHDAGAVKLSLGGA